MTDLDKTLARNFAPAPRSDLSDRILAASQNVAPANDRPSRKSWWAAAGGMAAIALAAILFVAQPASELTESEAWQQVAEASGFADLYDWVETDPVFEDTDS